MAEALPPSFGLPPGIRPQSVDQAHHGTMKFFGLTHQAYRLAIALWHGHGNVAAQIRCSRVWPRSCARTVTGRPAKSCDSAYQRRVVSIHPVAIQLDKFIKNDLDIVAGIRPVFDAPPFPKLFVTSLKHDPPESKVHSHYRIWNRRSIPRHRLLGVCAGSQRYTASLAIKGNRAGQIVGDGLRADPTGARFQRAAPPRGRPGQPGRAPWRIPPSGRNPAGPHGLFPPQYAAQ